MGSSPTASASARIVPWSSGNDTWPTSKKWRFNSVRDYSRPDTQTGKAAWLKPERLQVRLLLGALHGSVGNWQTTLAQNQGCCGFKSHLSYWKQKMSSQSSQECSPPCHGGDRRFKSDRGRFCSAVRKLAKRRSSNLRGLWVRLPPVLLQDASVGHWQASVAVTHPLSSFAGSTPARRTEYGPFV